MRAKLAQLRHEMGDRSTTPDSLGSEDSAQQRHQPDDFGSLTSLNICHQKTLSVTTSPTEVTLRQEDDELDSGIGGGRSSGGRRAELGAHRQQQKSTFELKRVLPSDAIIRRRLSGGEAQEPLTGLPPIASPPPAPSSVSNMQLYPQNVVTAAAVTPNRSSHHPQGAAPPPYHAVTSATNNAMGNNVGANSRSMSNLNYIRQTPHQQQHQQLQQQRNAVSTGRRRWNNNVSSSFITASAGAGCVTQQQGQQRCHPQGGGTTFGTQKPSNYVSPISNANHHPPSFHSQQFSSPVYNNNSPSPHLQPGNYQYQQLPHQQHYFQTPQQQQQNQLGGLSMSTSVSLNALRTMLADDGGSGAVGEIGDQQQSLTLAPQSAFDAPSPLPTSSMENSPLDNGWVRNSVSRRYLQNGRSSNKMPSSTTVWCPSVKPMVTTKQRPSNLFNTSGTSVFSSGLSDRCNKAVPTTSSSSTGTTPTGELLDGSPTTNGGGGGHGRRLYQPKTPHSQGSSSPEPPAHKGRMAMNKLKQRRLSTAREDPSSLDGVNPFRSRSQSPTHLAIQSLSALATSSQPPPVKPPSPRYGMSRISSSPSSTSRSQQRRLSSVNATRLQEARERLKKSQENLAALGAHGGQSDVADEETTMPSGIFGMSGRARSKSIGNLMRISVRNGVTAATLSEQQRQMAKSVTDLGSDAEQLGHDIEQQQHANAIDMTMSSVGGSRLAQLSASRQRLAQSIRDMRLISNSDLTEPSQYNPQSQEVQQQTSPDSANSSCGSSALLQSQQTSGYYSPPKGMTAMRRGVQKKIDRTSTSKLLRTDNPTFSRRTTAGNSGKQQEMRLRSVSSVAATQRINYMAQKLARSGPNSARSPSSSHGVHHQNHSTEQHQLDTARSLSIELASATHSLSNAAQMTSTGSTKKMAMHASECIQEMTRACDKLLGTRQLINSDPDISSDERRLLLSGVNRAISAFRQRLDSVLAHPGGGGDDGTGTGDEASVMTHVGKWDGEENGLRV